MFETWYELGSFVVTPNQIRCGYEKTLINKQEILDNKNRCRRCTIVGL